MAIYRPYKTDNAHEKVMFSVALNINHVNEVSNLISKNVLITVLISLFVLASTVIGILVVLVIKPTKKTLNIFNIADSICYAIYSFAFRVDKDLVELAVNDSLIFNVSFTIAILLK